MIPVAMGQQDVDRTVFLYQPFAQIPDARAGVQYQILTAGGFNVYTGSIAAVAVSIRPGRGD